MERFFTGRELVNTSSRLERNAASITLAHLGHVIGYIECKQIGMLLLVMHKLYNNYVEDGGVAICDGDKSHLPKIHVVEDYHFR